MTYKIELIKQLLGYVEQFESQSERVDLREFSLYLKEQVFDKNNDNNEDVFRNADYLNYKNYKDVEFSTLLTGLFRFAKHYLKKTFRGTSFKTIDEFGFLATLLREESLLKNELINHHHLEISSGSEILKRLIKNKLIAEYQDENDKRGKRIKITETGRKEIIASFDEMYKVSKIIRGNISSEELSQALVVLNKLTYFHNDIWIDDKNSDLNGIYEKYISNN